MAGKRGAPYGNKNAAGPHGGRQGPAKIKLPGFVVHKGVSYFKSYGSARAHAAANKHPTNRIISYGRGWAIQLRRSGPYVGPRLSVSRPSRSAYIAEMAWRGRHGL